MTDVSNRKPDHRTVTHMHIVDLKPLVRESDSLEKILASSRGIWPRIYEEMSEEDTLWVFAPNSHDDGECWPIAMATADDARDTSELILKNIISRYKSPGSGGGLRNVCEEILFFVKDKRSYHFDKDPIRVDHVYQGNEWGEDRETGKSSYHDTEVRRYNPNGKDPGNVWLNEIRNETAGKEIDRTEPLSRGEAIRRCLRAGSEDGEIVQVWMAADNFEEIIEQEGRAVESRPTPRAEM